jgi:hypothetical protein
LFQGQGEAALSCGDAALGAAEGLGISHECQADILLFDGAEVELPDGGGGGHVAAAEPFGSNEFVDKVAFFRCGRVKALVIFGDQGIVVAGIFRGDDVGLGVEAGFQGVLR